MDVRVVGLLGAGVMGVGLAQNLAQTDHTVILIDVSDQILDRAKQAIKQNVRFQGFFKKGPAELHPDEILERISFSTDLRSLSGVNFVIESLPEKWEVKQAVYAQLDSLCSQSVVFASNTSAIPITRIASVTDRADRVIGTHFMNPVPLKPVVEVIPGHHTSAETLEVTKGLLARMGKQWIVVKDSPGFVSNRVLMLTLNEAIFLLDEQVASAEDIDRLFTSCFGHQMGPLATADLIGLDTILYSLEVLCESFNDNKYRPSALLKKMVAAGLYGRKSGRGFYNYDGISG
ncbi:MAG: 3-hydroxyacyl-CoA dehydrogenase family protein [bacterium]